MELTPQERERIYREEKAAREGEGGGSSGLLLLLALGAVAGLVGFLALSRKKHRDVSLEDLRKAYPGLGPDEQE